MSKISSCGIPIGLDDSFKAVNSIMTLHINLNGRSVEDLLGWCINRWGPQMSLKSPLWLYISAINILRLPESESVDDPDFIEFKLTWC